MQATISSCNTTYCYLDRLISNVEILESTLRRTLDDFAEIKKVGALGARSAFQMRSGTRSLTLCDLHSLQEPIMEKMTAMRRLMGMRGAGQAGARSGCT
jgi:hypothetical protein